MLDFARFSSPRGAFAGLAAVALAGLAAGPPSGAEAATCPAAKALPRISLATTAGTLVYETGLDRAQLRRLQGRTGASSRKRGWHPIGLTLTELQFRMNIAVNTLAQGRDRHCATVGRVEASLGYDTITVHIDRRYRPGTCPYASVLAHENLHVAIFRDTLARYAPKVERRLTEAAGALRPVSARSPERAAAKIQNALQREMAPLFKEMNAVLDRDNERIDTADNYKREQAKCSRW